MATFIYIYYSETMHPYISSKLHPEDGLKIFLDKNFIQLDGLIFFLDLKFYPQDGLKFFLDVNFIQLDGLNHILD